MDGLSSIPTSDTGFEAIAGIVAEVTPAADEVMTPAVDEATTAADEVMPAVDEAMPFADDEGARSLLVSSTVFGVEVSNLSTGDE
jgi:hypothetical protein